MIIFFFFLNNPLSSLGFSAWNTEVKCHEFLSKKKIALHTCADLIYNKRVHLSLSFSAGNARNIFTIISALGFLIRVQVVPFSFFSFLFSTGRFPDFSGSPLAPVVFPRLNLSPLLLTGSTRLQLLFLKALTRAPCF